MTPILLKICLTLYIYVLLQGYLVFSENIKTIITNLVADLLINSVTDQGSNNAVLHVRKYIGVVSLCFK